MFLKGAVAAVVLVGATLAMSAPVSASQCFDGVEANLARASGAVIGEVVSRDGAVVTFRVDEVVKGNGSPDAIVVYSPTNQPVVIPETGPIGLIFSGGDSMVDVGACSITSVEALRRAVPEVAPEPVEVEYLLSSNLGYGLAAMDAGGDVIGYVPSIDGVSSISVCPGSTLAVTGRDFHNVGISVVDLATWSLIKEYTFEEIELAEAGVRAVSCDAPDASMIRAVARSWDSRRTGSWVVTINDDDVGVASFPTSSGAAISGKGFVIASDEGGGAITWIDEDTMRPTASVATGVPATDIGGPWVLSPDAISAAAGLLSGQVAIITVAGFDSGPILVPAPPNLPDFYSTAPQIDWLDTDTLVASYGRYYVGNAAPVREIGRDGTIIGSTAIRGLRAFSVHGEEFIATSEGRLWAHESRLEIPIHLGGAFAVVDSPFSATPPDPTKIGVIADLDTYATELSAKDTEPADVETTTELAGAGEAQFDDRWTTRYILIGGVIAISLLFVTFSLARRRSRRRDNAF